MRGDSPRCAAGLHRIPASLPPKIAREQQTQRLHVVKHNPITHLGVSKHASCNAGDENTLGCGCEGLCMCWGEQTADGGELKKGLAVRDGMKRSWFGISAAREQPLTVRLPTPPKFQVFVAPSAALFI